MNDSAPEKPKTEVLRALSSEPDSAALRLRITAGILYAAARFVPVPLLDDLLRERVAAWMVRNTLPRTLSNAAIKPLFSSNEGCLKGCLSAMMWIPVKLVLFPIRKVIDIALGVHWVSRDLAEMLLLGRVLDHASHANLLHETLDVAALETQSKQLRTAFDAAMKVTDTRVLRTLIAAALGPLRGLMAASLRTLRRFRKTNAEAPSPTTEDQPVIEASVGRVERMLNQPEIRELLSRFDAHVLDQLESSASADASK
jgi:hypothetical protein